MNLKITKAQEIQLKVLEKKRQSQKIMEIEQQNTLRKRAMSAVPQRQARNFSKMSINELKQHEKGILNLFESHQAVAQLISHNKNLDTNIYEAKLT